MKFRVFDSKPEVKEPEVFFSLKSVQDGKGIAIYVSDVDCPDEPEGFMLAVIDKDGIHPVYGDPRHLGIACDREKYHAVIADMVDRVNVEPL